MAPRKDNEKAVAARAKKAARAAAESEALTKAKEDALWNDPGTKRMQAAEAKKRAEHEKAELIKQRKLAAGELEQAEIASIVPKQVQKKNAVQKVSMAQIAAKRLQLAAQAKARAEAKETGGYDLENWVTPGNVNREGRVAAVESMLGASVLDINASGIDQALEAFSETVAEPPRMTYKEFEKREFDRIKTEFPTLKRTQVQERCFKAWAKSPENPANWK